MTAYLNDASINLTYARYTGSLVAGQMGLFTAGGTGQFGDFAMRGNDPTVGGGVHIQEVFGPTDVKVHVIRTARAKKVPIAHKHATHHRVQRPRHPAETASRVVRPTTHLKASSRITKPVTRSHKPAISALKKAVRPTRHVQVKRALKA